MIFATADPTMVLSDAEIRTAKNFFPMPDRMGRLEMRPREQQAEISALENRAPRVERRRRRRQASLKSRHVSEWDVAASTVDRGSGGGGADAWAGAARARARAK